MIFQDRQDAGKKLAEKLKTIDTSTSILLALPRGGVPVAYEISKKFHIPMDVIVARKLSSPKKKEFGFGAIAERNVKVINKDSVKNLGLTKKDIVTILSSEQKELERRVNLYRRGKMQSIKGKTVIIVDDGLATGVTISAVIKSINRFKIKKIVVAVPVCSKEAHKEIGPKVDAIECLEISSRFSSVGQFYSDFAQVTDEEVVSTLNQFKA